MSDQMRTSVDLALQNIKASIRQKQLKVERASEFKG